MTTITLVDEQLDSIILNGLTDARDALESDFNRLRDMQRNGTLPNYQLEDLRDTEKYLKAAQVMVEYFSPVR